MSSSTSTNLTATCTTAYATTANKTFTVTTNPLITSPNSTTLGKSLYNFVTITQGPRANIAAFENCFNLWECTVLYYGGADDDCYMDVQDSAIASENDYNETTDCLTRYAVPYKVFYAGEDPLANDGGSGRHGEVEKVGWKGVVGAIVVLGAVVGLGG